MGKKFVDSRAIPIDFLDAFYNGLLQPFVEIVKENSKELILCFRGNGPKTVSIYYNNHGLWNITRTKDRPMSYRIKCNINHTKYSRNRKGLIEELNKLLEKNNFSYEGKHLEFYVGVGRELDYSILKEVYRIMEQFMRDFFDNQNLIEKERQQKLYINCSSLTDGYYIYDLEFTPKGIKRKNQADFLALEFVKNQPKKILFGEVKSTVGAVDDEDSGLISHIDKMIEWKKDEEFLKNRKKEARLLLEHYAKLELNNLSIGKVKTINFDNIEQYGVLIVLTDDAIEKYDKASGEGKDTYRNIVDKEYSDKGVVVKKFVNGKLEDI